MKATPFTHMNGYLYKLGPSDVLILCALEHEIDAIIKEAWPSRGHFHEDTTTRKNLQVGLWWPKLHKYFRERINKCDKCQRMGQPLCKLMTSWL